MKKSIFTIACVPILLSSCQSSESIYSIDSIEEETYSTRSSSTLKLEETETGFLNNGTPIALPWASNAKTTTPYEIRMDVKEDDGWNVLYTNISIEGYPTTVSGIDKGLNYLLLYNRKSGVLKGYCYNENGQGCNYAKFTLTINKPTTLFNFVPYFALPMNSADSPRQITTSVVSENGVKQGF